MMELTEEQRQQPAEEREEEAVIVPIPTRQVYKTSNAPMETKLAALRLLDQGVKPENLAEELKKSGALEPAEQPEQAEADLTKAELYHRYLLAFLRYSTSQIDGLTIDEMEDVGCLIPKNAHPFDVWKQRRNV